MENSPLARLPAELRNDIYVLALRIQHPIVLRECMSKRAICNHTALARTCRAIRKEAYLIFYAENIFRVNTIGELVRYTDRHPMGTASAFRHVIVKRPAFATGNGSAKRIMNYVWRLEIKSTLRSFRDCVFSADLYRYAGQWLSHNRPSEDSFSLDVDLRNPNVGLEKSLACLERGDGDASYLDTLPRFEREIPRQHWIRAIGELVRDIDVYRDRIHTSDGNVVDRSYRARGQFEPDNDGGFMVPAYFGPQEISPTCVET